MALSKADADKALEGYGLPGLALAPKNDFQIVVEPIGLGKKAGGFFDLGSEILVVTFQCPGDWIIGRPNVDYNGSAGTVHADNFLKGDAATLYVEPAWKGDLNNRADLAVPLEKAVKIKAPGTIDDFTVAKVIDIAPGYKQCLVEWQIYSGAGFFLRRAGYFTACQVGEQKNLQILWTACLNDGKRFYEQENRLKQITGSFRVGKVPEGAAAQLMAAVAEDVERRGNDLGGPNSAR